jgi:hypothetical protein
MVSYVVICGTDWVGKIGLTTTSAPLLALGLYVVLRLCLGSSGPELRVLGQNYE